MTNESWQAEATIILRQLATLAASPDVPGDQVVGMTLTLCATLARIAGITSKQFLVYEAEIARETYTLPREVLVVSLRKWLNQTES